MGSFDEARAKPNALYSTQSITIQKPVGEVFRFLVEDMPTRYVMGRESFEVTEAGEMVEVDTNDLPGMASDQETLGRFEIETVPNRLVCLSFCPTGEGLDAGFIRNMFVYCDLEKVRFSETHLTMTSIVQLSSSWVKLFATIIGVRRLLAAQLTEDLKDLKSEIEKEVIAAWE